MFLTTCQWTEALPSVEPSRRRSRRPVVTVQAHNPRVRCLPAAALLRSTGKCTGHSLSVAAGCAHSIAVLRWCSSDSSSNGLLSEAAPLLLQASSHGLEQQAAELCGLVATARLQTRLECAARDMLSSANLNSLRREQLQQTLHQLRSELLDNRALFQVARVWMLHALPLSVCHKHLEVMLKQGVSLNVCSKGGPNVQLNYVAAHIRTVRKCTIPGLACAQLALVILSYGWLCIPSDPTMHAGRYRIWRTGPHASCWRGKLSTATLILSPASGRH
jgi:hypothetical protein